MGSSILFLEKDTIGKPNAVINPGFEKADARNNRLPTSWFIITSKPEYAEYVCRDSIETIEGTHALRIKQSPHDLMVVSDAFRISKESGYFIKCSAKAEFPLTKPIKVQFTTYDNKGNRKGRYSTSLRPGKDWKKATISAGFLGNVVSFARINLLIPKDPDNTIWIDDIGCYRVYYTTRK